MSVHLVAAVIGMLAGLLESYCLHASALLIVSDRDGFERKIRNSGMGTVCGIGHA